MSTTTFLIKTDKNLKERAQSMARELGLPLSLVVNSYLRQFVRDGVFKLSVDEHPLPKKIKELEKLSKAMDSGKNIGIRAKNTDELFAHLGV